MVALEVSINGKIAYMIGVGERGMMTAEVGWAAIDQKSGNTFEEYWIADRGLQLSIRETDLPSRLRPKRRHGRDKSSKSGDDGH